MALGLGRRRLGRWKLAAPIRGSLRGLVKLGGTPGTRGAGGAMTPVCGDGVGPVSRAEDSRGAVLVRMRLQTLLILVVVCSAGYNFVLES